MATLTNRIESSMRACARLCMTLIVVAASAALPARAQTVDDSRGGGVHVVIGGFAGRLDLHAAGQTDLLGGRAGIGFGELGQLTGYYWRGFDRSAEAVTADYAWGGELQFNLNTGFGVTPFVVGGIARVNMDESPAQTAAVAGAGLTLPLGPVLLHAGARDHMFGVNGLSDDDSPEEVTHNWQYSAGVTFALGRRRAATVVAAPPAVVSAQLEEERAALDATAAELRALRDSLAAAGAISPDLRERLTILDTARAGRSYHSAERIEVPIPTEGSITLRYGPETAAAAPVVLMTPGAVAAGAAARDPVASAVPAAPPPVATPPAATPPALAATLQDPANRAWLQQLVAAQVAQELALRPTGAQAVSQAQLDAMTQRVQDGVIAAIVPRLDASQAQRMNALREDLRVALSSQRDELFGEIARLRSGVAAPVAVVPATVAPPAAPADPARAPRVAPPETPAPPPPVAAAAEPGPDDDVVTGLSIAEARTILAGIAANHPMYLSAAETERGPAAVLGDGAFETGAALIAGPAHSAVSAVAELLRAHPDRRVYVHGHTDAVGAELQNQQLSELRAEAVRSLLVQAGVDADRIFAIGYGLARPVADNETIRGRALNRRVEIVIGESRVTVARD